MAYDEPEYVDDDEPDDESEFDCQRDNDGGCALAGTEECDWACPYPKPWDKE